MPPAVTPATAIRTPLLKCSVPIALVIYRLHAEAESARDVSPAALDIFASNVYLSGMFARVLSILAITSIAVVTTIGAAHATRMGGMQLDHTDHLGAMMHASGDAHPSCDGNQHCGATDASICEFVCTGLSVFLAMPGVETGHAFEPADHDSPAGAVHVSHMPGLNERPPKLRLL